MLRMGPIADTCMPVFVISESSSRFHLYSIIEGLPRAVWLNVLDWPSTMSNWVNGGLMNSGGSGERERESAIIE